jgi:hypothetical protein
MSELRAGAAAAAITPRVGVERGGRTGNGVQAKGGEE